MKKGISLVALVVTIVVLIILTVAVVLTINNDSIFDKADDAVKKQNELEAYSAVQMEVMQVRLQNIGEPIGEKFAGLLQDRLNEKYPAANAAVKYSDAKGEIGISYTLNGKEYKMILGKGYKLTMENGNVPGGEDVPTDDILKEEKDILQGIFNEKFPNGIENFEELVAELPEGWSLSDDTFLELLPIYTAGGNTFYVTDGEIYIEQKGNEKPTWLYGIYEEDRLEYVGKDTTLTIDDNTQLNNIYQLKILGEESMSLEIISDKKITDYSYFSFPGVDDLTIGVTNLVFDEDTIGSNIKRLKITSPITTITGCRYSKKLETVELPNTLKTIGNDAFYGCTVLNNITIPKGVTTIGKAAFGACEAFTEVIIPEGVESIGTTAFHSCKNLKNIQFPNTLKKIDTDAFGWCTSLEEITIPSNVTTIGNTVFNQCASLKTVIFEPGITSIGYNAFGNCNNLEKLVLPSTITEIREYALQNSDKLKITVGSQAVEKLLTDIGISADKITIDPTVG